MITNVHQREFRTTEARLGELLNRLGGPQDQLWPRRWPPMVLDRALGIGADGGHGSIRYRVTEYQPGRRVLFEFRPPTPLRGTHELAVLTGSRPGYAVLRHVLTGRPLGVAGWVWWTLLVRWLHDAALEDLLDRAGTEVGDPPAEPAPWSSWVRLGRRILRGKKRAIPAVG